MKLGILLLCSSLAAPASISAQQSASPRDPELAALLDVFRPSAPDPTREYVRQHFVAGADTAWAGARLAQLAALRARTGGLEEMTVAERQGFRWSVLGREKLTGWWIPMTVVLDSMAPHRIVSFSAGAARPRTGTAAGLLPERDLLVEVADLVRAWCAADVFSGVVAIARGDTILFEEACGDAIKGFAIPNTVGTRFNLASANKMFTAIAIARLIQDGALSLTDSLAAYLPDVPTAEAAGKIRIEHLLTHTSGLPDMFPAEWTQSSKDRFRNVVDYVELVRGKPLAFEPGTRTQYSNTGFLLLGRIVEVVTGRDFPDYVHDYVLAPARMGSTCFCELDEPNAALAVGYKQTYGEHGVTFRNNLYTEVVKGTPAGGAFSSAGDIVRFMAALDAGRIVDPVLVRTFTTPKSDLHPDLSAYGYGFITRRGGRSFGHNGGSNGMSVEVERFRDRGYTMVVLSNYGSIAAEAGARIRTLMVQGLQ